MTETFTKHDNGKPEWDLLPESALEGVVRVLMYGAKKYGRSNWKRGASDPEAMRRVYNAMRRHLNSWKEAVIDGDDQASADDDETGLSHLWHAACNIVFLLFYERAQRSEFSIGDFVRVSEPDNGDTWPWNGIIQDILVDQQIAVVNGRRVPFDWIHLKEQAHAKQ